MKKLATTYMGLNLKNPVMVSSSGLTSTIDSLKHLEDSMAAAVVLKSLFEEQILHEAGSLASHTDYPEADDYLRAYVSSNNVEKYLEFIAKAKSALSIPVIASINCFSAEKWMDFALKIQQAGADALEVNAFILPVDNTKTAEEYERVYFLLAESLKEKIDIPVSFKLGDHFTNPLRMVEQLWYRNVKGVVLFNRFFAPDIDIEKMRVVPAEVFSHPADIRNTLRWVALTSGRVHEIDISASTGVHSGEAAIKLLLAGARTTQVCSALYRHGHGYLKEIVTTIDQWMSRKGYKSVDDFRGSMSYGKIADPSSYERSQFMKHFSSHD